MKIEVHILQNFAVSNLNRDDTGAPKDCEFGGVRRARISSQCFKRAMRDAFELHDLVPPAQRAARTKRLVERVAEIIAVGKKVDATRAKEAVAAALGGAGIKADPAKEFKTEYLLFLPSRVIEALADVVGTHLDALAPSRPDAPTEAGAQEPDKGGKKKKDKKKEKAAAAEAVPKEIAGEIRRLLEDGARTPELALFGRMIADAPEWNVDAACQVGHALSTHRVAMEFDFYTAIDDLKKSDTAGSDMMGTISFNSACFYRYLVVDAASLTKNLGADDAAKAQAKETTTALLRSAALAIPSGKQNSMAAHNCPSLVLVAVVEKAEPRSLANAFVDPVRPGAGGDLVAQSIARLGKHLVALDKVYGKDGRKSLSFVMVTDDMDDDGNSARATEFAKTTGAENHGSLAALIKASVCSAFEEGA